MLTDAQYKRLEQMTEDTKVVGIDRACPLVKSPGGRVVRILENGRTVAATRAVVEELQNRQAA